MSLSKATSPAVLEDFSGCFEILAGNNASQTRTTSWQLCPMTKRFGFVLYAGSQRRNVHTVVGWTQTPAGIGHRDGAVKGKQGTPKRSTQSALVLAAAAAAKPPHVRDRTHTRKQ